MDVAPSRSQGVVGRADITLNEDNPDTLALVGAILRDAPKSDRWFIPTGYPSVALALIDAIYSTGNHYGGVLNALARYRTARHDDGADPETDSASNLLAAAERWGGVDGLAERTNQWRTSTKSGAPRKAQAVLGAAGILVGNGLDTRDDIRQALMDPHAPKRTPVKERWLALPGQRSGLTWTYFLMLCGIPGVKADRMVTRYLRRALDRDIDPREAAGVVAHAARTLGVEQIPLDHVIWRIESGRPIYREM